MQRTQVPAAPMMAFQVLRLVVLAVCALQAAALAADTRAVDALLDMNALLASPDPKLRDEVAYATAERLILRERALTPDELRRVAAQWSANLENGLGERGTDTVFVRSFSALCLSLVAAADRATPFLTKDEAGALFDRLLDYFARERDLRGFDPAAGWMHSVAHTADALNFLARNPDLPAGTDTRLLAAVRTKILESDVVFAWGENDRMARALHAALRRDDADPAALRSWVEQWVDAHGVLWASGPLVDPVAYARVENARQVLSGLYVALAHDASSAPGGARAQQTILEGLARMR
jgi:hypothetical protein